MKRRTRIILSVCLAVLLVIGIGGYAYVSDYYHADETALEAMAYQTDSVQTEQDGDVIWFVPEDPTAGLIFYPGGKVEHTAYAPLMRACAENGILCALVWMPGNLAVLDANAAYGLQQEHPEVTTWYIAGHSLGGGCHAQFGSYGPQNGDGIPTISGEEQVRQTAEAIAAFVGQ